MGRVLLTAATRAKANAPCVRRYCECHPSAMGHVFRGTGLICECGWGWFSHQQNPKPCPGTARWNAIDPEKPSTKTP
jgi:hypothetical protein